MKNRIKAKIVRRRATGEVFGLRLAFWRTLRDVKFDFFFHLAFNENQFTKFVY